MKLSYTFLSGLLATTLLSSCVDDSLTGNQQWQQGDTPYYIKLRLHTESDLFTRAESTGSSEDEDFTDDPPRFGYESGTHYLEHAINPNAGNFAIFFDNNKNYVACADLYSINEESTGTNGTPYPEATYSCRFYGFAGQKPKYVLVVVNAPERIYNQITNYPGYTLDETYKLIWEERGSLNFDVNGDLVYESNGPVKYTDDPYNRLGFYQDPVTKERYFTMTNTTYIGSNGELQCAIEIPEENITTDPEDIDLDFPDVTVYLERMVAKYDLTLDNYNSERYIPVGVNPLDVCVYDENGGGTFIYQSHAWGIQLLGWGLNGLETQNYLFKNVDKDGKYFRDYPLWNSSKNKRCYWSEDPHYLKDEAGMCVYPWQFHFGADKYDVDNLAWYEHFQYFEDKSFHQRQNNTSFALTYYPFTKYCEDIWDYKEEVNDLRPDFAQGTSSAYNFKGNKIFYTPENTFKPGQQIDRSRGTRSYELASTHVLLCARLLVNGPNDGDYVPLTGNLYRNRVGVCYRDELSLFEDFKNAVNFKLMSQGYLYYKYYPWDDDDVSDYKKYMMKNQNASYYGETMRAEVGGEYSIFCYFRSKNHTVELTSYVLKLLMSSGYKAHYNFIREADAVNADGKIIPWIMYREGTSGEYEPLDIYILKRNDDYTKYDFVKIYTDPETGLQTEYIEGNPANERYDYINERGLKFEKNQGHTGWVSYEHSSDKVPGTTVEKKERDDNDIQSLFYEIWGVADCFNHGLMYYAVPIYAQAGNGTPAYDDSEPIPNPLELTDPAYFYYYYGVVRNNWYKFKLHSISDIGIPVTNPTKPIVPNYTNKKDQIKVEMEILQWHIEDQTVEIN